MVVTIITIFMIIIMVVIMVVVTILILISYDCCFGGDYDDYDCDFDHDSIVIQLQGVDYSAIIWGVGNNSLKLPVPNGCPESFKLLLSLCWFVNIDVISILLILRLVQNHITAAGVVASSSNPTNTWCQWLNEVGVCTPPTLLSQPRLWSCLVTSSTFDILPTGA